MGEGWEVPFGRLEIEELSRHDTSNRQVADKDLATRLATRNSRYLAPYRSAKMQRFRRSAHR